LWDRGPRVRSEAPYKEKRGDIERVREERGRIDSRHPQFLRRSLVALLVWRFAPSGARGRSPVGARGLRAPWS